MALRAQIGNTATSIYPKAASSTFTDVKTFHRKTEGLSLRENFDITKCINQATQNFTFELISKIFHWIHKSASPSCIHMQSMEG